ncbi:MAG: SRPBCC family protein [Fodinibius sp.]|nr:SRPBCC family protein [Fodinibius sp.]
MKILKIVGITIVVMVILFFGIATFLPSQVHVERTLVIPASSEIVFDKINDLREWKHWSPWYQMDPNMEITYEGFLSGEGASYSWKSENGGSGTLIITESHPNKYIATEMDFMNKGKATAFYRLKPVDGGTQVTWAFETTMNNNPVEKYMGLIIDRMVGTDFEKGLHNLKNHVQQSPSQMMTSDNPERADS